MRRAPEQPRFGVGHAVLAWLLAFVLSNIVAGLVLTAGDYTGKGAPDPPLWLTAVLEIPLWTGLIAGMVIISRKFGTGRVRRDYGFAVRPMDAAIGIPLGVATQLIFVPLLVKILDIFVDTSSFDEPAKRLTDRAEGLGIFLLIVVLVLGAPIVEELFFRGLVLRAIAARYSDGLALFGSAVMFGIIHFQPLQLPALIMFGLLAGYLSQRYGRLGPAIFAHAGFNGAAALILLLNK
ncbi:MAG: lysostaphin resistance A-like protein [Acidimicrobiia bacterium]